MHEKKARLAAAWVFWQSFKMEFRVGTLRREGTAVFVNVTPEPPQGGQGDGFTVQLLRSAEGQFEPSPVSSWDSTHWSVPVGDLGRVSDAVRRFIGKHKDAVAERFRELG